MDDLLSEKEQIEKLRTWWSDYGYYVIGGVVLGAAILFGFNYNQSSRLDTQLVASSLYDTLMEHVVDGELDEAGAVADELADKYADTSYAAQSKLIIARLYMDRSRERDAAEALNELLALDGNDELKHVGRIRLAKILLYQEKAEEAVALLEAEQGSAFAARYAETRGDAYVALGRFDAARDAYRQALNETGSLPTVDQSLLQLKLLDLPEHALVPPTPPVEDAADEPGAAADPVDDGVAGAVDDTEDTE